MTGIDFYPYIRRRKQSETYLISSGKALIVGSALAMFVFILDVLGVF